MSLEKQPSGIPWSLRILRQRLFPNYYLEEEPAVTQKPPPTAVQEPLPEAQQEPLGKPTLVPPRETQGLGKEMVLSSGIKARYSPGYEPTPRRRVDMDPFPEGDIVVDSLFRPAHSEANLSPQEKARRTKGGRG